LSCIALSTLLSAGASTVVHAAPSPSVASPGQLFGVHPVQQGRTTLPGGHFNYALVAGQSVTDGIVVENLSDHALNVSVYSADLLTAAGGGLAPAQPTATMHEVGAWITVSAPSITIAAHRQVTDAFTVTVPMVVSPGQHLGAVVASADAGMAAQGNPIEARVALIAVVTVPGVAFASGALTPLAVSAAGSGQPRFGITLSNTGNVLLTYAGSLEITGDDGRHVASIALLPTSAYVVPGGKVPLAALWKETGARPGSYRVQVTVEIFADGAPAGRLSSQVLTYQISAAFPTLAVVAGALVIAFVLLLAAWCIGRRRRHGRIFTRERVFPSPRRGLSGVR
jgi:hypothetical protein